MSSNFEGGRGVTENDDVLGWEGAGGYCLLGRPSYIFFLKTISYYVHIHYSSVGKNGYEQITLSSKFFSTTFCMNNAGVNNLGG